MSPPATVEARWVGSKSGFSGARPPCHRAGTFIASSAYRVAPHAPAQSANRPTVPSSARGEAPPVRRAPARYHAHAPATSQKSRSVAQNASTSSNRSAAASTRAPAGGRSTTTRPSAVPSRPYRTRAAPRSVAAVSDVGSGAASPPSPKNVTWTSRPVARDHRCAMW